MSEIYEQTKAAFTELCEIAQFAPQDVIVIGGSSSEIRGGHIGKDSSAEVGEEAIKALMEVAQAQHLELAIQCCEHLNRALVVERKTAERLHLQQVTVVPWLHAGGSFSTNAMALFDDPVVVEEVSAAGGLDIGCTMIGMHLRRVVVPVRLQQNHIGAALVVAARTRFPLIGGERARYTKA